MRERVGLVKCEAGKPGEPGQKEMGQVGVRRSTWKRPIEVGSAVVNRCLALLILLWCALSAPEFLLLAAAAVILIEKYVRRGAGPPLFERRLYGWYLLVVAVLMCWYGNIAFTRDGDLREVAWPGLADSYAWADEPGFWLLVAVIGVGFLVGHRIAKRLRLAGQGV